jgi:UDP-GlcNAc:undecaprenyl-phosphate GlcNAc-1-phosphate transferase
VTRAFLLALVAALVATPLVRGWARRIGAVAKPRQDRWHQKPTALLGGVAIAIGIAVSVLSNEASRSRVALALSTSAMFALGVYDDRKPLRPREKLLGQLAIVSAYVLVARPLVFGNAVVDSVLAVLFLAFVCNALNLLDHIDGLAAGAAAIGAFGLAHGLALTGLHGEALFACAIAGAALGYFVFNVSPASIFMGDGGSLSLGFALGALALEEVSHGSTLQLRIAPIAFLALPLLDSSLVIVARVSEGRAISQGGRDHSSHRLVALGLDDRKATMALHVAAMVAAAAGGFLLHAPLAPGLFAMSAVLGLILALGSYLLHAPARTTARSSAGRWLASGPMRHARRLVHDLAIAGLAFTGAITMRFDGDLRAPAAAFHLHRALPIVAAQALVLHLCTRGRASWRDAGGVEVLRVIVATGFASAIAALFASSRGLVAIDGLLLAGLACGSMFSRRAIDSLVASARNGCPALVYAHGAESGALLEGLRRTDVRAIALVVDDAGALGPSVSGVPVLSEPFDRAVARLSITDVCISPLAARGMEIARLSTARGLRVRHVGA